MCLTSAPGARARFLDGGRAAAGAKRGRASSLIAQFQSKAAGSWSPDTERRAAAQRASRAEPRLWLAAAPRFMERRAESGVYSRLIVRTSAVNCRWQLVQRRFTAPRRPSSSTSSWFLLGDKRKLRVQLGHMTLVSPGHSFVVQIPPGGINDGRSLAVCLFQPLKRQKFQPNSQSSFTF